MRLDGVEIKISLVAEQTAAAMKLLDLPDVPTWAIHFIEDVTPGLTASTPLLDEHLIIRARQKTKGCDVAVKLRPGRRSQLATSWLKTTKSTHASMTEELKVEEDWAADRRSLAISLTAKREGGGVTVMESTATDLLTENQKRFIRECGHSQPGRPDYPPPHHCDAVAPVLRPRPGWGTAIGAGGTLDGAPTGLP